ncbi:hypothetical protein KUCAC02_018439, partial [Chaenocephalus aceratus]
KGRCDPSSPDGVKLLTRCQRHFSTHLHMLETEGRCSVATDRTRDRKHDTNAHWHSQTLSHIKVLLQMHARRSQSFFFPRMSLLLLEYVQMHKMSQSVMQVKGVLIHGALK